MMHEQPHEEGPMKVPESTSPQAGALAARSALEHLTAKARAQGSFGERERSDLYMHVQAIFVQRLLAERRIENEMDYFISGPAKTFRDLWGSAIDTASTETVGEHAQKLMMDAGVDRAVDYLYGALTPLLPPLIRHAA